MLRFAQILGLSLLATLALSSNAFASPLECTVKTVKDGGDYENEYDFEFAHYPNFVLDLDSANGKSVLIGAMTYSEQEDAKIQVISAYGSTAVEITPAESDERFYVRVNFRQGTGDYQRFVNGAWVAVAELECK